MTFHTQVVGANGQRQAMFIERVEGLAEAILANFELGPPDAMIVFSASGRTAVPIEMAPARGAAGARDRRHVDRPVRRRRAAHPPGRGSLDHADVVLDLVTPPGDALVAIDGLDTPVAPGSTLAAVALANEIKARTARAARRAGRAAARADQRGVVGPERSAALFDAAYAEHARRLRAAARRQRTPG